MDVVDLGTCCCMSALYSTLQEEEAVPSFSDGSVALRIGGEIRLKLLGVRFDASQIFAVATINADYLGPIEPRDAATA